MDIMNDRFCVGLFLCLSLLVLPAQWASGKTSGLSLEDPANASEAEALYCLAMAHLGSGALDEAISELAGAARFMPRNPAILNKLVSALAFKATAVSNVQDKMKHAGQAFEILSDLRPLQKDASEDFYDLCMGLGGLLSDLKMYDQALGCFGWAWDTNDQDLQPLLKSSEALMALRDWKNAIQVQKRILSVSPDHKGALYDTAFCLWQLDHPKRSLKILRFLILDPQPETKTLFLAGVILTSRGRRDEARHMFLRIVESDPKNVQALRNVASLAQQREDWQEAARFYGDILKLEEKDRDARFGLAMAYERSGMFDRSVSELHRVIAEGSRRAEAMNYLGYMYAEQGIALHQAERLILSAMREDPLNGAYVDSLGWVYFKKGESERALTELQRALQLIQAEGADDPVVREHLGDVHASLGNHQLAMKEWRLALKQDPQNSALKAKIQTRGLYPAPR